MAPWLSLAHSCARERRSKEDILSEIRRLQSQMAELEDRVSSSAKVTAGAVGLDAKDGAESARGALSW